MKRNEKKVPEFDDIIFENRNMEYGAYDLRRRYKSVTSFSILGAIALCITVLLVLFFTTDNGTASTGRENIVILKLDKFIQVIPERPEVKIPPELVKTPQNVVPEVVSDTAVITSFIPITDEINQNTTDGNVNDSVTYTVVPDEIVPAEPKVFIRVEEMPEFPGGESALLAFIGNNVDYPAEAIENNIEGRIFLKFVVQPDGSVGKIEILKGVDPLLDGEAIRVVSILPRFKPGKQNGEPVAVWYSVPVLFKINK
jgi:periplasmic protein TonB